MRELEATEKAVAASPDRQISLTDPDARAMASAGTGTGFVGYNLQAAVDTGSHIIVAHEMLNLSHDRTSLANMGHQARAATGADAQARLDRMPGAMHVRRRTVEHVFGTIKDWMGRSHLKTRILKNVATEMSLHVLAYNIKRAIALVGVPGLIAAMEA